MLATLALATVLSAAPQIVPEAEPVNQQILYASDTVEAWMYGGDVASEDNTLEWDIGYSFASNDLILDLDGGEPAGLVQLIVGLDRAEISLGALTKSPLLVDSVLFSAVAQFDAHGSFTTSLGMDPALAGMTLRMQAIAITKLAELQLSNGLEIRIFPTPSWTGGPTKPGYDSESGEE